LAVSSDRIDVRDLKSTNGTRINGHRIQSGQLQPGDELAIAGLRYRLIIGATDAEGTVIVR
jgi:pSer/pThr/pTyr-binding forkhead associated (FHA) protein